MNKSTKKFMDKIYILRDLVRYNNAFRIKDESVAEHLAFVTLIVIKLHETYKFDLGKAVIMAASHDLAETDTTDAPHNVKRNFPKIKAALEEAEMEVYEKEYPGVICENFKELEKGESIESKVVLLADAMSCIQYSESEIKLGNQGYMPEVYNNSLNRVIELEENLKEFER